MNSPRLQPVAALDSTPVVLPGALVDRTWAGDLMASEVSKSDDPPREVLAPAFRWFAQKLDIFTEEAAKAAGRAFGTGVGGGAGIAVTGQLPKLMAAVAKVAEALQ